MVWGVGRLLVRAAGIAVRRISRLAIWPSFRQACWRLRPSPGRLRRLGIAALVVALVAPAGVELSSTYRHRTPGPKLSAVGEGGSFAYGPWGGSLGSRPGALDVDLEYGIKNAIAPPSAGKRTALIVGINHARGGRPLPGSITDANNLRDALLAYGFKSSRIKMLIEQEASAIAIRKGLESLARRTPRDGLAVFAVATHTRRRGGRNELLTADGNRISSTELASRLGRVRSRMWVALPTCYAGGYALPGIIGPRRIATFASPRDQQTYQLGSAGSYLFINMVRRAMLEGGAPKSVESSFRFAVKTLKKDAPDRVPHMLDGIKGELVLGRFVPPGGDTVAAAGGGARNGSAVGPPTITKSRPDPDPAPPPTTPAPRRISPGICGRISYNCSQD